MRAATSAQRVDVWVGKAGILVGQLTYAKQGQREFSTFVYDAQWLASNAQGYPLAEHNTVSSFSADQGRRVYLAEGARNYWYFGAASALPGLDSFAERFPWRSRTGEVAAMCATRHASLPLLNGSMNWARAG